MSEDDQDPGEDDGGVDVDDVAVVVRSMAVTALRVRAASMTVVDGANDLPLGAAMGGPGWAAQTFRPGFDPYVAAARRVAWAGRAVAGIDMARFDYAAPPGDMIVIDAASFTLIVPPAQTPVETILRLDAPQTFAPPDAAGWRSTAPATPVQKARRWSERIDALERGERTALLVFKIRGSARAYAPSTLWF